MNYFLFLMLLCQFIWPKRLTKKFLWGFTRCRQPKITNQEILLLSAYELLVVSDAFASVYLTKPSHKKVSFEGLQGAVNLKLQAKKYFYNLHMNC